MAWTHTTYRVKKSNIGHTRLRQKRKKQTFVSPFKNIDETENENIGNWKLFALHVNVKRKTGSCKAFCTTSMRQQINHNMKRIQSTSPQSWIFEIKKKFYQVLMIDRRYIPADWITTLVYGYTDNKQRQRFCIIDVKAY